MEITGEATDVKMISSAVLINDDESNTRSGDSSRHRTSLNFTLFLTA